MKRTIISVALCLAALCGLLLIPGCRNSGSPGSAPASPGQEGTAGSTLATKDGATGTTEAGDVSSTTSGSSDAPPDGSATPDSSSGGTVTTLPPLTPGKETSGLASVNVKDFGAKGDGKADDTAAVQAAIDQVFNEGGGYVYLPAGTYRLAAVNIKKDVCLYSDRTWNPDDPASKGETVLVPRDESVSCVVDMSGVDGNKNSVLMNVCIDGQNLGKTVAGVACPGLSGVSGNSMRVEDVRILNCTGVGLDATNNAIASVRGCMITGCGTGLKLVGWDLFIYNNMIAGNKGDGVTVSGGSAMSFHNNRIGWNDGCGVRFDGFQRVSMTGNTLDSNACPGVYFSGTANVALHGNLFIRNGWSPSSGLQNGGCQISVNASSGINITANTVQAADDTLTGVKAPEYGIIGDILTNCVIQGNTLTGGGTKGALKTEEATNLDCVIEL